MSENKFLSAMLKSEKNILASMAKSPTRILTKSPSLNWALSGGLQFGYTTCWYGPEGSGKSLLSMLATGALHQLDPEALVVLISTEMRTPNPERIRALGVDPDRLIIRQVNTLHDVFDWIASPDEKFKNSDGTTDMGMLYGIRECKAPIRGLIIDSIKGIQGPKEQKLESVEKDFMGDLSKALNVSLRTILPVIRDHQLMTIFVQQVNMNMDADEVKYQNKKYTIPSGQALKHFCETMALVERVTSKASKLFNEDVELRKELFMQEGHTIRVKVDKANLDTPFREAEFRIHYRDGVVQTGLEVANLGKATGAIKHPLNAEGAQIAAQWVFEPAQKKWIGWDKMVADLEEAPELQRQIMGEVYKLTG